MTRWDSLRAGAVCSFAAGLSAVLLWVPYVYAQGAYGAGGYGTCAYNACGITITSGATVSLDVTPSGSTACTVRNETVGILSDSSTGYTVTLSDNDTSNTMAGSNGGTVLATSGSYASPAALAANRWGYRVDGRGSFGAGPASTHTNGAVPAVTFAAVPPSSGSADTIISSSGPANPVVNTPVWYGLCADSGLPSGSFSNSVVYTALVNS